jgi:hypothetical protein
VWPTSGSIRLEGWALTASDGVRAEVLTQAKGGEQGDPAALGHRGIILTAPRWSVSRIEDTRHDQRWPVRGAPGAAGLAPRTPARRCSASSMPFLEALSSRTASALAALSLNPPMITVALNRGCELLAIIGVSRRSGVNVLGSGHQRLAYQFATKGHGKFDGVPWTTDTEVPRITGPPRLAGLFPEKPGAGRRPRRQGGGVLKGRSAATTVSISVPAGARPCPRAPSPHPERMGISRTASSRDVTTVMWLLSWTWQTRSFPADQIARAPHGPGTDRDSWPGARDGRAGARRIAGPRGHASDSPRILGSDAWPW